MRPQASWIPAGRLCLARLQRLHDVELGFHLVEKRLLRATHLHDAEPEEAAFRGCLGCFLGHGQAHRFIGARLLGGGFLIHEVRRFLDAGEHGCQQHSTRQQSPHSSRVHVPHPPTRTYAPIGPRKWDSPVLPQCTIGNPTPRAPLVPLGRREPNVRPNSTLELLATLHPPGCPSCAARSLPSLAQDRQAAGRSRE